MMFNPELKKNAVFNWSGGKDSMLALHYILQNEIFDVQYLLTSVSDKLDRIATHGVRSALLIQQARSLNLPLYQIRLPEMPGMEAYEEAMEKHLNHLKLKGITHSIFGDIYLEDLRVYRENMHLKIGLTPLFPLWKKNTVLLVNEFISLGYKTIVVCAKEGLEDFCGRIIDENFLNDLPEGVDPCGENGEFHTFVFDGPLFKNPVRFELGEKLFKEYINCDIGKSGYWYIDLIET